MLVIEGGFGTVLKVGVIEDVEMLELRAGWSSWKKSVGRR